MRHTLFISDLHLAETEPTIARLFLKFLKDYASNPEVDALYILGDFFNVWVGDDDTSPFIENIKQELQSLVAPVYLMPGNRDFLLGQTFASQCKVFLIPDPYKIDLYGKPTLLMHGDILCTKDKLQTIFRRLTQGNLSRQLFLTLPINLRRSMAKFVHDFSTRNNTHKSSEKMDIVQNALIKRLFESNCMQIIHGHTHKPNIYNFTIENKNIRRIVLGSWEHESGQTLQYNADGTCEILYLKS
jgi:UDP-2,3-diacylglucosamine hydrolase